MEAKRQVEPTATDPNPVSGHYHRITLATDGSKDARVAATAVAALPWDAGTTITVVGVAASAPSAGGAMAMTGVGQDAAAFLEAEREASQANATEAVGSAAAILREAGNGVTVVEAVRTGNAADEILAQAKDDGAELVVAGARGHGMLKALVLGSVSDALVERSACPVLIVRGGEWAAAVRVLVAVGPDDDQPERLGDAVLRLPLPQGSQVVVASVTNAGSGGEQADRLATHLTATGQGLAVESRSLTGDTVGGLLRTATEIPADLIVAGARARSGMRAHLGLGSVSRALVRRAACSVLVVRPAS